MKYFSTSYWFKLWVLSAPLFNDKTQGINAKSIDNKKIKDWVSNNINLQLINQDIMSFKNSSIIYQPYNLSQTNKNINPIYQTELETTTDKYPHKKNRNKRTTINQFIEAPTINIIENDIDGTYFRELRNVIEFLRDNDFIRELSPRITNVGYMNSYNNPVYYITPTQDSRYQNFILPIRVVRDNGSINTGQIVRLVIRQNALYLQGFIVNNNYYYFQDSTTRNINIPNLNRNIQLSFSSNYDSLIGNGNPNINWDGIFQAFNNLINYSDNPNPTNTQLLRLSLPHVILATSESMRFRRVQENIISTNNHLRWNNEEIVSEVRNSIGSTNTNLQHYGTLTWDNFRNIINNWGHATSNIIDRLREGTLSENDFGSLTILTGIISAYVNQCQQNRGNLNRRNSNIKYCFKKITYVFFTYWNHNQNSEILHFYRTSSAKKRIIYTVNLGKLNPIRDFNRLEFLGDVYSDGWGTKIKWGSWIYDGQRQNIKPDNTYDLGYYMQNKQYKFHDLIRNVKVNKNISPEEAEQYAPHILQQIVDHDFLAAMNGKHSFGLNWYLENNDYYLQLIFFQYLKTWASGSSLDSWLKIGSGIKLYSDNSDRSKRSIFVDNANVTEKDTKKFQEKNELRSPIQSFKNIIGFDNSTVNTTIPSFDISAINSMNYENQSVTNVSNTNIPTI